MKESYDDMIEREGGYYLFVNAYRPDQDIFFDPFCAHCAQPVDDLGDGTYEHFTDAEARACWERRNGE